VSPEKIQFLEECVRRHTNIVPSLAAEALAHIQALTAQRDTCRDQLHQTHNQVAQLCRHLDPECAVPDAWTLRDLVQKLKGIQVMTGDTHVLRYCDKCDHDHQGEHLAFICIGCPCPERPGETKEHLRETIRNLEADLPKYGKRIEDLTKQKDGAYAERNQCVALIARMALKLGWLAGTGRHPDLDTDWEDDWRTILFVNIPDAGQVSWHFHDTERHLLARLPEYPTGWDGHDTPEKYRRVNAALSTPTDGSAG
jgi:hypothetical protein